MFRFLRKYTFLYKIFKRLGIYSTPARIASPRQGETRSQLTQFPCAPWRVLCGIWSLEGMIPPLCSGTRRLPCQMLIRFGLQGWGADCCASVGCGDSRQARCGLSPRNEIRQVCTAQGISPFVIVPGQDLKVVIAHNNRRFQVDKCGIAASDDIC